MRSSIQRRLLFSVGLTTTGMLLLAGVMLDYAIRDALIANFDAALTTDVQTFAHLVDFEEGEVRSEFDERTIPRFSRLDRPDYYELQHEDGRTLERLPELAKVDYQPVAGPLTAPEFRNLILPGGRLGRQAGVRFTPALHQPDVDDPIPSPSDQAITGPIPSVTLMMARDTHDLNRTMNRVRWIIAGILGGAVLVSVAVGKLLIPIALEPLHATAQRISQLSPDHFGAVEERFMVDASHAPEEILAVVDRLNELLRGLRNVLSRERAFSANIAHELRTPLAGLRTILEVSLNRPRSTEESLATTKQCLQITIQTQTVIENILTIARLQFGLTRVALEDMELEGLIADCWQSYSSRAQARGIVYRSVVPAGLHITTDRQSFRILCNNLMDNAVSYTNDAGRITIDANAENHQLVAISFSNTGSQLSADQIPQATAPFWRGDTARADTGQHAGLGLSLCLELSRILGLQLIIKSELSGEFEVILKGFQPSQDADHMSV